MTIRLGTGAAIMAFLLLAGCAEMKKVSSKIPLFHTVSPDSFTMRRLDTPEVKAYIETHTGSELKRWPLRQWTVDQMTLAAFHYHPDLSATEAWALRNRMMNILVDYYSAHHLASYYRKQREVLQSIVDIFEQRSVAGQGLNLNASQILIMYQEAQMAEKGAEVKEAEAQAMLASVMGVPLNAVKRVNVAWPEISVTDNDAKLLTEEARDNALMRHSQLVSVPKDKMTVEQFNALQAKIIGDIELAQVRYKAAREKLMTGDSLLSMVKTKTTYLPNQVGDGELSRLPSLLAQSNIDITSIERLEAQVEWLKAKVALEYALEQPLFGKPVEMGLPQTPPVETDKQ